MILIVGNVIAAAVVVVDAVGLDRRLLEQAFIDLAIDRDPVSRSEELRLVGMAPLIGLDCNGTGFVLQRELIIFRIRVCPESFIDGPIFAS